MSVATELAKDLAVSGRTVRRAVNRQTLRGVRPSPNQLEIAEPERRYAVTHWALLQGLIDALRTERSVETAILFGSTARGDDTPDSDVDLVVQLRADATARPGDLRNRLSHAVNREVEIVALDDVVNEPQLLLQVIDDGRPLIDRAEQWRELRRRRNELVHRAAERRAERNKVAHASWAQLCE